MQKKINKSQLGKDLQEILATEEIKIKATQGEDIIEKLFAKITEHLKNEDTVEVYGYIKLEPKLRAARNGRNPSTGKPMVIAETKTVKFTPLKKLKDAIKG